MNEFKNWDDLTITDDFMFCKVMLIFFADCESRRKK